MTNSAENDNYLFQGQKSLVYFHGYPKY